MNIIEKIFEYPFLIKIFNQILDDKSKIKLISCSKIINQHKFKLRFNQMYFCVEEDQNKWFFNCLTNINTNRKIKISDSVTHLHYWCTSSFPNIISNKITHLNFGYDFDFPISEYKDSKFVKSYIPNSVVHLSFPWNFSREIIGLPNSLQYLKIYSGFCKIKELPKSLKYLMIHKKFKDVIKEMISEDAKIEFFC